MARNRERYEAIDYEIAVSFSEMGTDLVAESVVDSQQAIIGPQLPSKIVHTTVTTPQPDPDNPPNLELKLLMEEPPTPITPEDVRSSLRDSAQDCYCRDCGPNSTCVDEGTKKRRADRHLSTLQITSGLPRFTEKD